MIQCVDSRNEKNPYCSRVCCSEAVRTRWTQTAEARRARVVLYRDIRTYGFREVYYQKAREAGVLFVRFAEGRAAGQRCWRLAGQGDRRGHWPGTQPQA